MIVDNFDYDSDYLYFFNYAYSEPVNITILYDWYHENDTDISYWGVDNNAVDFKDYILSPAFNDKFTHVVPTAELDGWEEKEVTKDEVLKCLRDSCCAL